MFYGDWLPCEKMISATTRAPGRQTQILLGLFGFLLCVVAVLFAGGAYGKVLFPGKSHDNLTSTFHLTGSFRQNGPMTSQEWSRPQSGALAFDSSASNGIPKGKLESGSFTAPPVIHFFVSGFPLFPGQRLYLVQDKSGNTTDLTMKVNPAYGWKMHYWQIPEPLRGTSVHLVAEDSGDGPEAWIGLTAPEAGGEPPLFSISRALYRTVVLVFLGLLALVPGVAILLLAVRAGCGMTLLRAAAIVICGSSIVSYVIFGLYLLGPPIGRSGATIAIVIGFASIVLLSRWWRSIDSALLRELRFCLLAVILASVFYNSLGFMYKSDDGAGEFAQARYTYAYHTLPPDNLLPDMVAERLYEGQSLRSPLLGYWHSSDRPPLQSSVTLLEMPFFPAGKHVLSYEFLGVFLQCTWVAGIFVFLRTLGVSKKRTVITLGFCLFSFFCLMHSFYVWSKLLSATFCLLGLAFFPLFRVEGQRRPWTVVDVVLASLSFSLGTLCHPGVAFSVLAILVLAFLLRALPPARLVPFALAACAIVVLPWVAYQKFYDPPGDNLMKAHFAGVIDFDHSLGYCVMKAYRALSFRQYLSNKWENVQALVRLRPIAPGQSRTMLAAISDYLTLNSFFALSFTVGLLNLGFLARTLAAARPRKGDNGIADRILLVVAIALAIWCLIMFEPGSTIVHQGSFATVLLLFIALSLYLAEYSEKLACVLLGTQVCLIFPLFVFNRSMFDPAGAIPDKCLDLGMSVVAALSFLTIAAVSRLTLVEDRRKGQHAQHAAVHPDFPVRIS